MAPQVRMTNRSLPPSHDHIVSYSGFNSREEKIHSTFSSPHMSGILLGMIAVILLGGLLTGCSFPDGGIAGRQSLVETAPTPSLSEEHTTPPFSVFLPPLPSDVLAQLHQQAMEVASKSTIRSKSVIDVHHVKLDTQKLFDEVLRIPSSTLPPVIFPLSALSSAVVITDRLRETESGLSWVGHIQNSPTSSALFLVDATARTISGEIRTDRIVYEIRPGENGTYAIFAIDPNRLPPDHSFKWYKTSSSSRVPESLFSGTNRSLGIFPPVIDFMVFYTQNAINSTPDENLADQICRARTQLEESFINSGVEVKVRLVHHEKISFPESGDTEQDTRNLRDTTFPASEGIPDYHPKRTTFGADIVSLWVGDGNDCGDAEAIIQPGGDGALAFAVVRRNCATTGLAFAHELGHLMGGRHDRFNAGADTDLSHNYGYILPTKSWMTIMAVNLGRTDCQPVCTRKIYWSNPLKTFPPPPSAGDAMGRPDDPTRLFTTGCKKSDPLTTPCDGPANMAATLNVNADVVSRFTGTGILGHVSCNTINNGTTPGDITPPALPSDLRIQ